MESHHAFMPPVGLCINHYGPAALDMHMFKPTIVYICKMELACLKLFQNASARDIELYVPAQHNEQVA